MHVGSPELLIYITSNIYISSNIYCILNKEQNKRKLKTFLIYVESHSESLFWYTPTRLRLDILVEDGGTSVDMSKESVD